MNQRFLFNLTKHYYHIFTLFVYSKGRKGLFVLVIKKRICTFNSISQK